MKLTNLKLNEQGIITKVKAEENIKKRLMDIGFIKGVKIKPVLIKNNIKAYQIKGTIIAVRDEDIKNIEVKK